MPDLMFNRIDLFIASTFVCVVMAAVVWMRLRSSDKLDNQDSKLNDQRTVALFIQAGDWINAGVKVVIGVLLGVSINGLVHLISRGAWVAVFNIAMLSAGLLCIVLLHDYLGKKFSGIRPARKPEKVRKAPLVRRLSLPAGLVFGFVLAGLGLDGGLYDWLL